MARRYLQTKISVDVFKTEFEDLIQGYTKDQIFNADETGLNFKMLPNKSLAAKAEMSAPGHKLSKERITVLACSNASGSFCLPLMCIGKSKKPRALKNINQSARKYYTGARKKRGCQLTYLPSGFMTILCRMLNSFWRAKVYLRRPYF